MENQVIDQQYSGLQEQLPNSTATLVLGILSIVSCFCYGLPGLVLAIIALAISSKPNKMYREKPEAWLGYSNLKAGRIMAIIGLCLSGLLFLFMLIYILFLGGIAALSINEILNELN